MANILLSKFETYLLDEEYESELKDYNEECFENKFDHYKEFPEGFFTSL